MIPIYDVALVNLHEIETVVCAVWEEFADYGGFNVRRMVGLK